MILQILIIIIVPLVLIKFRNNKIISLIGTTGVAYLIGIILAGIIYLLNKLNINASFNKDVSEFGSHIAIGIAIPLLLFSTNLKSIKNLSKTSFTAFLTLVISVSAVSIICGITFEDRLTSSKELAGMAVGLYTGGTPNLNAIGNILGVKGTTIAMANLSDMLIGGVFYMFLLTICKPLLKRFLNAQNTSYYKRSENVETNVDILESNNLKIKPIITSIAISFVIVVIGAVIGFIIWIITGMVDGTMASYLVPAIMITATILGLLGSCFKRLREVKGNNLVGHYLILVFSIALAMYIDFEQITPATLQIFLFFAIITIGSFILHSILCKIFKVDVDSAMITLTAGLYGPAFIPAIAKAIDNEKLIPVGLICGSLGYAIGTFIGSGVGYVLLLI